MPWRLRGSVGAGGEPERFVDFARAPHTVEQHCELSGHCDNGAAIGPRSSSFQDAPPKLLQVAVRAVGHDVLTTFHEKAPEVAVTGLADR